MTRFSKIYWLLLILISAQSYATEVQTPLDSIVAIVNDHIITATELQRHVVLTKQQLAAQKLPIPSHTLLRHQVLQHLIDTEIQLDVAHNMDMKVSDHEVDLTINNILRDNHINRKQFTKELSQEGISYKQYRENIKKQLLVNKLQRQQVANNIILDQQQVEKTAAKIHRQSKNIAEYHIQHILLPLSEEPSSDEVHQAKLLAGKIVKELKSGANFKKLAIAHSRAPDAMQGGDWGWRKAMSLPSVFVKALSKMKAGAISNPIRTGNGYHILKYIAKRDLNSHKYSTKKRLRHILLLTPKPAARSIVLEKIKKIRARLKMGTSFAEVAMAHSEDPISATKGGDLGWIGQGELPPKLQRIADHLKVGEISRPVHTALGWHILQVTDVSRTDLAHKQQMMQAKDIVFHKSFDKAMQTWLKQLRENAYIKIIKN